MKFLGATILVLLLLATLFVMANWPVLTASSTLSFVFFETQGTPALIGLGLLLVVIGLLALYLVSLRTTMFREAYKYKQEMEVQRKLAESAEASRIKELREEMHAQFSQLMAAIDESANGLAAHIGEVEEKVDQALGDSAGR